MPLAKLAIKQPIFISMVLLAAMLVGMLSYLRMGVDLYPDMSNPVVSVSVSFPGASPEDVETLVTKRIERAVSTVSGVDSVSATSREGSSNVMVVFDVGYDLQQGAQEVRERLDIIKRSMPEGAGDPVMRRFDPNTSPFMTISLSTKAGTLTPAERRRLVEEVITPRLERLPGVAAVQVNGLQNQEIGVDLTASRLKALGVTPQQVVNALRSENATSPSGRIAGATENMPLSTYAQFQSLDDIKQVVVARHGARAIQLQEVATIGPRLVERQSYNRINGDETLTVELQKQSGSNVVQTAQLAQAEIKSLAQDVPQLGFTIVRDDSTFIQASDHDVTMTLILGALLAACIVLLFFRNFRNTLITVAGLPIIVIGTFAVISLLGYTRNIITLMALSLSVGLLIDDAIVVRENIFRHMEGGEHPRVAADKATGEIAFAVLAITLTLVAMFIPVAFTTGQIGRLFKEFGITVAVAVLISMFEAFTFAPLLSAYFAKPMAKGPEAKGQGSRRSLAACLGAVWQSVIDGYRGLLAWSLRHRLIVAGSATGLFLMSLWLMTTLPFTFYPTTDPGSLTVSIQLPPGTPLAKTDEVAREVERVAMGQPEVTQVYTRVGGGSTPNQGNISIMLKEGTDTDPIITRFRGALSQYGRTLNFTRPRQFMGMGGGMGGGGVGSRPIVISVQGPTSLDTLSQSADLIIERLRAIPGLRDVDKSLPPQEPVLRVVVDRQRAASAGISPTTAGQTIRTLVQGTAATQVDWQDQLVDVTVQLRPEDRSDAAAVMDLPIATSGGDLWPLSAVARVERGTGPTVLQRQQRQGQMTVGANLEGQTPGSMMPIVRQALAEVSLPPGITWKFSGQQAQAESAFGSLIFALVLGLIFVYMVLASQFGSIIHPLTVMVALPLAAIGAVLALVAARAELSVIAMIGIILLMGLATKNSILIVDFIIRYRKEMANRTEAVLAAGPLRLRPILMTSMAIILGMVPTALGMGAAGAFRAPMAIAVLGGVFTSTALSLVVVPVVYTLMDDFVVMIKRVFRRETFVTAHPKPTMPNIAISPNTAKGDNPGEPAPGHIILPADGDQTKTT